MAQLRFDKVSFTYPNADKCAVENVDLTVEEGEFVLLIGSSGCGKTTLIRQAKPQLAPSGKMSGEVYFDSVPVAKLGAEQSARQIGFVQQDPDAQIVTDFVWHELAFGMECLGYDVGTIRRRVAEMAAYFGMEGYFRSKTHELSGGQKQLLNLASTLTLDPRIIILDEPTAMLDPLAARELLQAIYRVNKELGIAVLITEHRLEQVMPMADKVAVMDGGKITDIGCAVSIAEKICDMGEANRAYFGMSAAAKIFHEFDVRPLPLSVRDARVQLKALLKGKTAPALKAPSAPKHGGEVLSAKDIWFRYDENGADVLRGASVSLYEGEMLCLLGGNGAGKSTLLASLCGLNRPYRGRVKLRLGKRLCLMPQNARTLFSMDTVFEELLRSASGDERRAAEMAERLEIAHLASSHPYDLSGGETQRLAMGKLLLTNADVLLLDEPTKGLDAYAKYELAKLLKGLCAHGTAMLTVTHDVEFAALYADECAMMFDGGIISRAEPHEFFANSRFYTTDAARIAGDMLLGCISDAEVTAQCKSILE